MTWTTGHFKTTCLSISAWPSTRRPAARARLRHGRLVLPLARAGFEITGVEPVGGHVADGKDKVAGGKVAGGKAAELGRAAAARIALDQADMRTVELRSGFRLAFIAFNSFLHLTNLNDQLQALRAWHQAWFPAACWPSTSTIPTRSNWPRSTAASSSKTSGSTPPPAPRCSSRSRARSTPAGRSSTCVHLRRGLPRWRGKTHARALRRALPAPIRRSAAAGQAGFALEQVYGSYDLDPYTGESDRMIFVARRR